MIQDLFDIPSSYFSLKAFGRAKCKRKVYIVHPIPRMDKKGEIQILAVLCQATMHGSLGIKNEPVAFASLAIQIVPWEGFQLLIHKIECQKLFQSIQFENVQVYDYDWGLRDDFMGEASLPLGQLVPQKRNDLVLTLAEPGFTFSTDYEDMKPLPQLQLG